MNTVANVGFEVLIALVMKSKACIYIMLVSCLFFNPEDGSIMFVQNVG
jgi:hypothetical protein